MHGVRVPDKRHQTGQPEDNNAHGQVPNQLALARQAGTDVKMTSEVVRKLAAKNKPSEFEIAAWSEFAASRVPTDLESRAFFNEIHKGAGPSREDISTWFDVLDLDDFVSFGGKA